MKAWIHKQTLSLYTSFCSLLRRDKIVSIGVLVLSLILAPVAVIWLHRLFDSNPWIAYSAGVLLFIRWMWYEGYPALKRRITEGYHEIATGGVRQVPGLCKRSWNDPGLFGTFFRLVIFLLLIYPFVIVFRAALPVIFHPIFLFTSFGVCSLVFIHWMWRRVYPALQRQLGTIGKGCVYSLLGMSASGLAYVFARQYINTVTGVDPGNFSKALGTLTTFALVPALFYIIALSAALIGVGFMAVMIIDTIGCDLLNHWQQFRALWSSSRPQTWFLPHWRIPVNMIGAFGIFLFCGLLMVGEEAPISYAGRAVATHILVFTEFSHDHTCPRSSKERLVARLNDFQETKPRRFLFAEQLSPGDVQFSIDTCE
jgi:hypothetical protein